MRGLEEVGLQTQGRFRGETGGETVGVSQVALEPVEGESLSVGRTLQHALQVVLFGLGARLGECSLLALLLFVLADDVGTYQLVMGSGVFQGEDQVEPGENGRRQGDVPAPEAFLVTAHAEVGDG